MSTTFVSYKPFASLLMVEDKPLLKAPLFYIVERDPYLNCSSKYNQLPMLIAFKTAE